MKNKPQTDKIRYPSQSSLKNDKIIQWEIMGHVTPVTVGYNMAF